MDSAALVRKAIGFSFPDRIPLANTWNIWGRVSKSGNRVSDIELMFPKKARDFIPAKPGMDEWGCVWKTLACDKGQVVEHPLEDWGSRVGYKFPDPFAPGRFDDIPSEIAALRKEHVYVLGDIGSGPMHRLDYLRGFENYLSDLILNPDHIEFMLDGIFQFMRGMVRQHGELGVDGINFADDQAMQTGPLFSMDVWRRLFKPRYRELFDLVHAYGMHVHMHACGHLGQHLVDLVDAGVDVIDNKQPSLWMNSPQVDEVRGKVVFSTCVDIQSTVHSISCGGIEDEVDYLIRRLSTEKGGFIGTCYPFGDLQISAESMNRMLDAFRAFRW